jgi:beta-lactamase superfamily II metal-dependent hydrolase
MGVDSNPIVALIGTGGGYGESVVLRLYEHCWIIIDSCVDPNNGKVLPLDYLYSKNVDVENDVKFIVCTHWHSDHITGLDKIVKKCEHAEFICAIPSDREKFLAYIMQEAVESSLSSTKIFNNCITIISNRNAKVKIAHPDRVLHEDEEGLNWIASLSPSDEVLRNFLLERYDPNVKSIYEPNDKCIVLLVNFANHYAIIGGDLTTDGWSMILCESILAKNKKSELIKIPHHGSNTAYHEAFWDNCISSEGIALVSAYNKGETKLPTPEMLEVYISKSKEIYLTSPATLDRSKMKERNITLKKIIRDVNKTVVEIPYQYGLIESELVMNEDAAQWQTCMYGSAVKLEKTN